MAAITKTKGFSGSFQRMARSNRTRGCFSLQSNSYVKHHECKEMLKSHDNGLITTSLLIVFDEVPMH